VESQTHPELKEIIVAASRALACLDAERLEELAMSCQALNREVSQGDVERRRELACESKESAHEMEIFARVLEATRANLKVMNRLRELRANRPRFGYEPEKEWTKRKSHYGID
jgi:hypothetical protein